MINKIYSKYKLSNEDINYLENIISEVVSHSEFQKRMTKEYLHHSDITLGEHILEDVVVTYLLSKKEYRKNNKYRIDLAVKIALLHDLYTLPWQNNPNADVHHFFDKHGFRHPVEAVINAINWYPELFTNIGDSRIIIDGILHHMYPLPVRYLDSKIELKNKELLEKIDDSLKKEIENSLKRKKIGKVSFTKSKYKEGRIMSKADKKVSRRQIKNFSSFKALATGLNKKIIDK